MIRIVSMMRVKNKVCCPERGNYFLDSPIKALCQEICGQDDKDHPFS